MSRRKDDLEDALAKLRQRLRQDAAQDAEAALAEGLADSRARLVALAAEEAGIRLLYALEPHLIAAFRRLAKQPYTQDPRCAAKSALVRALFALDCADAGFYREGMRLRQLEPVWGGSQDTATDVRVTCAQGLASTTHARALPELALLLGDPEPRVRAGVTAAITCADPIAAEAVLRTKALAGDPEPEVTGSCLSALLTVAPEASPGFVGHFLDGGNAAVQELAALALGESRLDAALAALRARWDAAVYKGAAEQRLLRAAVLHRSQPALDWLVSIIADGERRLAEPLLGDLAIYRTNDRLRAAVEQAVTERADPGLRDAFERHWRRD